MSCVDKIVLIDGSHGNYLIGFRLLKQVSSFARGFARFSVRLLSSIPSLQNLADLKRLMVKRYM